MVVGKRCGTCIDRKIRCDRGFPACYNCIRTNRVCQGYGVRLSWPRDRDRKRFIVGPVPPRREHGRRSANARTVHVTAWDMELYRYLAEGRLFGKSKTSLPSYTVLSSIPSTMTSSEVELLYFFESRVSGSLTTLGAEPVGNFILRIALSGNSPSDIAVQQAMLALSYVYRYGTGLQAEQSKLFALRALITSASMGMTSENAVQHVAAGMILCLFEISHHSESSWQWMRYITGAKDVIANAPAGSFSEENGSSCLVDWAYYHEVLARFSLRHWRPRLLGVRGRTRDEREFCLGLDKVDKTIGTYSMFLERNRALSLLSDICKIVLPASDPRTQTKGYRDNIAELEQQVQCSRDLGAPLSHRSSQLWPDKYRAATAELHRIATLIYLARSSNAPSRSPEKLTHLVDSGMAFLTNLEYCDLPFPILMVGLEARDDEERLAVLELIERTQLRPFSEHRLGCVRNFLCGIWSQADLHADEGVQFDYMETLTAVISTCDVMPPFV